jgi:hypothetical protein
VTPAEFCAIGEKLYGRYWQSALARELARDTRTIRRWKSAESPVPKVVEEWLLKKAETRGWSKNQVAPLSRLRKMTRSSPSR